MSPKTIFLSAFFLFASALCLQAQGVYEYDAVTYTYFGSGNYYQIGVSISNNYVGTTQVKSKFESKGAFSDLTPLLEKVNELAKEGWEVYSTSTSPLSSAPQLTYNLRRKKP